MYLNGRLIFALDTPFKIKRFWLIKAQMIGNSLKSSPVQKDKS